MEANSSMYQRPIADLITELKTSAQTGLTQTEATKRLERTGLNQIIQVNKRTAGRVFLEQFKNVLVLLLVGSTFISLYLGFMRDSIVLLLVVFF